MTEARKLLRRVMLPVGVLVLGIVVLTRTWGAAPAGPALLVTLGPAGTVPNAGSGGTAVARLDGVSSEGKWRLLFDDFAVADAPRVSYDGSRLLFAGRRHAGDPMQIWEVSASGSRARPIVRQGDPLDPCYLPDGRIVFARSPSPQDRDGATALYSAAADGGPEHRITFGEARDRAPAVLPDGRIVFRRHASPVSAPGRLFVVAPDGTGLAIFCEPAEGASIERGPWVIGDRVVFAEQSLSGRKSGFAGQRLVSVSALEPFGKRDLLGDAERSGDSGPEWFAAVAEIPKAGLITAAYKKDSGWTVHPLRASDAPSERVSATLAAANGFSNALRPIGITVAAPRPRPLRLTSVVDERKGTGTLLCTNVYTSRLAEVAGLQRGSIRAVRVLVGNLLIGEAPVEVDGSFFVEVPADRPLHLELLGPDGVVASDHGGFWVRPNENRGCIGCHEDPELAPENRVLLALSHGPTRMATTVAAAPSGGDRR